MSTLALERMVMHIIDEVQGAQKKFPTNQRQLAAATEEHGELAKALLDHAYEKAPASDVYKEAVQSAAMAVRIALEGSAEFPYRYDPAHADTFTATGAKK